MTSVRLRFQVQRQPLGRNKEYECNGKIYKNTNCISMDVSLLKGFDTHSHFRSIYNYLFAIFSVGCRSTECNKRYHNFYRIKISNRNMHLDSNYLNNNIASLDQELENIEKSEVFLYFVNSTRFKTEN